MDTADAQEYKEGSCSDVNHSTFVYDVWQQVFSTSALENKTYECSSVQDTC